MFYHVNIVCSLFSDSPVVAEDHVKTDLILAFMDIQSFVFI